MQLIYQKNLDFLENGPRGIVGYWWRNAERPQVRNGKDDVKQKIPKGTAWVGLVTVIVKS